MSKTRALGSAIAIAIALGLATSVSHAFNPQPDPPAKAARVIAVNNLAFKSGLMGPSLAVHGPVGTRGSVGHLR